MAEAVDLFVVSRIPQAIAMCRLSAVVALGLFQDVEELRKNRA